MSFKEDHGITEDEAAVYDRQIRLWGLDAQKRLRAASILIVSLNGLGAEVAKNLILAGVKAVTLQDHHLVTTSDLNSQFLISNADIGLNRARASQVRAQQFNPMVTVHVSIEDVVNNTEEYFQQFNVVCLFGLDLSRICRLADICHKNGVVLFIGDVFGYYGGFLADLGIHEYAEEIVQKPAGTCEASNGNNVSKKAVTDSAVIKKAMSFNSLSDALSLDWCTKSKLKSTPFTFFILRAMWQWKDVFHSENYDGRSTDHEQQLLNIISQLLAELPEERCKLLEANFTRFCSGELSPVCAIVGGILAQEVIKCVSKKDVPLNNSFFYNGKESSGLVEKIGW